MGDKKETDPEQLGMNNVYGQLLSVATSAKGREKMDQSIGPIKDSDRKWLENALDELACEADPVKKLKALLAQLMDYKHETEEDLVTLTNVVDSLIDLVCDLDVALDFCKLNGLKVIEELMDKDDDEINRRIIRIIAEIAQNNHPVQKLILPTNLLRRLLIMFQDPLISQETRLKVAGAISAIVKGYPPSVIEFCKLDGIETTMSVFRDAVKNENKRMVHRCVVTITNIGASARPELISTLNVDIGKYLKEIRTALEEHGDKFTESIEYLDS